MYVIYLREMDLFLTKPVCLQTLISIMISIHVSMFVCLCLSEEDSPLAQRLFLLTLLAILLSCRYNRHPLCLTFGRGLQCHEDLASSRLHRRLCNGGISPFPWPSLGPVGHCLASCCGQPDLRVYHSIERRPPPLLILPATPQDSRQCGIWQCLE